MKKINIHIVYEYGITLLPHSSAYIRLLRPLTHPALSGVVSITQGSDYQGLDVDAVIVDRTWRPDVNAELASALLDRVHRADALMLYAIDDNLLHLRHDRRFWNYSEDQLAAVELFLRQADGVLVTTDVLRDQLAAYNTNVVVVPNMLDDRLITRASPTLVGGSSHPVVIGYMGTLTHDDDLLMILPALEAVAARHPEDIVFEIIGGIQDAGLQSELSTMGFRALQPEPGEDNYPLFMLWFGRYAQWDIGLAPLRASAFSEAKSDIKFLDYSAVGAATVCSDVPAYSTVRHGETGLCVENTVSAWESALERLVTQPALRTRLAINAWWYLLSERTVAVAASIWLSALECLID
jgi:glycosyltransferase involved in cell wall biosynthesis